MNAKQQEQINRQGRALLSAYPDAAEKDPVKLCKRLFRLEKAARLVATRYNNGDLSTKEADAAVLPLLTKARAILGTRGPRIRVNWDSRGCTFKISEKDAAAIPGIYRDMGGYGIIAPTLDGK